MLINTGYHYEWQLARINWMLSLYPVEFWEGKSVLELAPCNGAIGEYFRWLGAKVTSVEGRAENVLAIKERFQELNIIEGNLDSPDWIYGKFDVIINFGLFYHLENFHKEHLINCVRNSDLLFFESVVYDSRYPELYETAEKVGNDQSLSGIGKTPSTSYVETILNENNCKYSRYDLACLNAVDHKYDWVAEHKNKYHNGQRRMWIIENVSLS